MKRALLIGAIAVAVGGGILACSQLAGVPPPPPVSPDASTTDGSVPDAADDVALELGDAGDDAADGSDDAADATDGADAGPPCTFDVDAAAVAAIPSVNAHGVQNIPAAVTPGAKTILIQRGDVVSGCQSGLQLFIADQKSPGWNYNVQPVNPPLEMNTSFEEDVTLTANGLSLIALNRADEMHSVNSTFYIADRQPGSATFKDVRSGPFANIQTDVGSPMTVWAPVISADGLEFFYVIQNDPSGAKNGIYDSVRATNNDNDAFPGPSPATFMQPLIQNTGQYVSGITADRRTLFVEVSETWDNNVFTRNSINDAWENPNVTPTTPHAQPPVGDIRAKPYGTCNQILATLTSPTSGCHGEQIARSL